MITPLHFSLLSILFALLEIGVASVRMRMRMRRDLMTYNMKILSLLTTDVTDKCIEVMWTMGGNVKGPIQGVQLTYVDAAYEFDEVRSEIIGIEPRSSLKTCGLESSTHYDVCVWLVKQGRRFNHTVTHRENCVTASTMSSKDTEVYIGSSIGAVVFVILFMIFLCILRIKCSMLIPKLIGRKGSRRRRSYATHHAEAGRVKPAEGDVGETSFCEEKSGEGSEEKCALCSDRDEEESCSSCDGDEDDNKNNKLYPPNQHQNLRPCNSAPAFHCITSI